MKKTIIIIGIILILIGGILLSGCSDIQSALESKEQKCAKERAHCEAECNALEDIFGCSKKCGEHYDACVM